MQSSASANKQASAFLREEFFTVTLLGALGRSGLWKNPTSEKERKEVHRALRRRLEQLAEQHCSPVSEVVHLDDICALADGLSAEFAPLFRDGRFRVGLAQKALNLYLKYLWCAGFATQPPHCPVDAIILAAADIKDPTPWTKLDSIDEYANLIARLRPIAAPRALAEWELELWSKQKEKTSKPRRVC